MICLSAVSEARRQAKCRGREEERFTGALSIQRLEGSRWGIYGISIGAREELV